MSATGVAELQRAHARFSRTARELHRLYREYPGFRSRETKWLIINLQQTAWAFAYAARVAMEIHE